MMEFFNVKSKVIIYRILTISLFLLYIEPCYTQDNILYTSTKLSNNRIKCITQDKIGYIWIGTDYGLNKYDGYHFKTYLHNDDDHASLNNNMIVSMAVDEDGTTWIGTAKGLQKYDIRNDGFIPIKFPYDAHPRVTSILPVNKNEVWIATDGCGIYSINKNKGSLEYLKSINDNNTITFIKDLYKDCGGNIWVCGGKGKIGYIDHRTKRIMMISLPNTSYDAISIVEDKSNNLIITCSHQVIRYSLKDKSFKILKNSSGFYTKYESSHSDMRGNIYFGTNGNGMFYLPFGTEMIKRYEVQDNVLDINKAYISSVFEDKDNNLWIGCCYKGLFFIPNRKKVFSSCNFSDQGFKIGTYISSICCGKDGEILCVVQNDGIYLTNQKGKILRHTVVPTNTLCLHRDRSNNYWVGLSSGLISYNPANGAIVNVPAFKGYSVNAIDDDGKGTLYVSLFGRGFCQYNTITHRAIFFDMYMRGKSKGHLNNNWILSIKCDSHGYVWLGDAVGLCCYYPKENSFLHYKWKFLLNNVMCLSFCQYDENQLLIGTTDGLYVFDYKKNHCLQFPQSDLFRGKEITNIFKDSDGDIWCSTSVGVWLYRSKQKDLINYLSCDGLTSKDYSGKGLQTSDGRIYLGTGEGFVSFLPSNVKKNKIETGKIQLTNFIVNNRTANCSTLSNDSKIMDLPLDKCHSFKLSYIDNTCVMEFSTMRFDGGNIQYEYKLNNDRSWTLLNKGANSIEFTHLIPGTYQVEVRAASNGNYSPSEIYYIEVLSPWYASIYAFIVYFIIVASIIILSIYIYIGRKKEELNKAKMQFMINTTHDIRSPLTLILNPVRKLMNKKENGDDRDALNTIYKNAQRILGLVNQLLDVKKIEAKQFSLHYQETDMVVLIDEIVGVYSYHASERGIDLSFEHHDDSVIAWVDRTNMDKVLMNLMSNAFNFTDNNGKISIVLSVSNMHYIEIKVIDNGISIKDKDIRRIFDRFYQSNSGSIPSYQGSGIGLNFCKLIVELHNGTIEAENLPYNKGVSFIVRLPIGNERSCQNKDSVIHGADSSLSVEFKDTDDKKVGKWSPYRMLLVDDDPEICRYIKEELSSHYKINVCENGKDALKELLCYEYDIVVSDVMMPEMDGLTLVHKIKSNPNISHIPVVLLTSKTEVRDRISGFDNGADAYVSKPFDIEELNIIIRSQIKSLLRLKGKFSGAVEQKNRLEEKNIKGYDDQLMDRIMNSINNNLSNSEYSIDMLTEEVGISRSHLYRKMKEMTGLSVTDFIKNIRLEQASRLIREHKVNISQVCFEVGFCNLSYFSTAFKRHFGVSPREYAEKTT